MQKIRVLDHGYVGFVEAWGTGVSGVPLGDEATEEEPGPENWDYERGIIEAARQSTQGTFRSWDEPDENGRTDQKLLEFLYEKKHSGPFEFAGMVIEVQAPLMVFREWHRHRTQSYNEMSARYVPLPALNYHLQLPDLINRAEAARDSKNRQASAASNDPLDVNKLQSWLLDDMNISDLLREHYENGLRLGVPKELARKKVPVDNYSRMRASANLRNWLAFMTLRCDPAAQWEIRQYAWEVAKIIESVFPRTAKEWMKTTIKKE